MVERVEIGPAGAFDKCDTPQEVADMLLDGWGGPTEQFRPVTEEDRKALTDLLLAHNEETQQFLDAIRARPVQAVRIDHPGEVARRRVLTALVSALLQLSAF